FRTGKPLQWTRVHDLPDFVYFDHSVHVQKGVACITCHGQVDKMPLMWREQSLHMEWCLQCHRHPEDYVGERSNVFSMLNKPSEPSTGKQLVEEYHIRSQTHCSTCHR